MSTPILHHIADPASRPLPGLDWRARLDRLRVHVAALDRVVVAYSGGVDSSVVLRVAHEVLGDAAIGVIGRSDSYALSELEAALAQAADFGVRVDVVTTSELSDPRFASNPADRCYHCKSELYARLDEVAARFGARAILDGTIVDDMSDHRPGRRAAAERAVRSPLAELGFTKADVRAVAAHYAMASTSKPASPCLASRIPYGTPITREALGKVERAEAALRALGLSELRVRHHGDLARIEVPLAQLPALTAEPLRSRVVAGVRAAGYLFISLDLEGFRSGSLNRALEAPE